MKFTHRPFRKEKDLELMRKFLFMRKEKVQASTDFLAPFGVIVENEGVPVCLGFLIKCDNKMGIFSDFLSDPNFTKGLRNAAAQYMRGLLIEEAKKSGLLFVTSFTKHEKLAKHLNSIGYKELDKGFFQMGRSLWL